MQVDQTRRQVTCGEEITEDCVLYDESEDFRSHENEFDLLLSIVAGIVDLKGKTVLDVGGGQGMHLTFLQRLQPERIYETDIIDYESLYDGDFRRLLRKKHERNGYPIDLSRVVFVETSATDLLFKDCFFDVVVSINAFEHISDPCKALGEIVRCLKPGGYACISFDPLYCCDTGSHMFPFVPIPWAHLVHSQDEYVAMMREANAGDSDVNDFLLGLNRLTIQDFRSFFGDREKDSCIEIVRWHEYSGLEKLDHKHHPNFAELRNQYSEEDLMIRGAVLVLRKL